MITIELHSHRFINYTPLLLLQPIKINAMNIHTKQPSCEKVVRPKKAWQKSCEIKGGGQEMAAMMLMLNNFNKPF